jgi:hypothetical protein
MCVDVPIVSKVAQRLLSTVVPALHCTRPWLSRQGSTIQLFFVVLQFDVSFMSLVCGLLTLGEDAASLVYLGHQ